ncbi:hypothetical protein Bealeia1_00970 [Candidatus Bealeia paramacronuclearis]|uniref:DUF3313 domain-containing protein n=1 Tax=Candidatus Bealeia paramacronuclearis TaxID=1921001 RepID=A0ABZ2C4X3_9PROT|nr:hypothetical protein [Candidatus Bealeia paramacronuclearis]
MFVKSLTRIIPFALLLNLTGCSEPKMPEPMGLTYLTQAPLKVDVAHIEVVKKFKSKNQRPHVEHEFPVPPIAMVQQWVHDRFLAVGKSGTMTVTIEDASVVEVVLKGTKGFKGLFTIDQSERYDANVALKIEVTDDAGTSTGFTNASAKGSKSVSENMTLGQRRKVWMNLMEKVLNNLDGEVERNVQTHLGKFLK